MANKLDVKSYGAVHKIFIILLNKIKFCSLLSLVVLVRKHRTLQIFVKTTSKFQG